MTAPDEIALTELTMSGPPATIEITVAGHTVAVEGPENTAELAALALYLYRTTELSARAMTTGFSAGAADLRDAAVPRHADDATR